MSHLQQVVDQSNNDRSQNRTEHTFDKSVKFENLRGISAFIHCSLGLKKAMKLFQS